ncbi:MAG: hypothetical protein ACTHVE_01315 [Senegalia sp. (in: firmicutes)]|uniref:hypothetical protein n=1 Tax=Senegalia sp. (in: firmicutes) TaxID=1924098 RepID=UPI003F99AB6B
MDNKGITIIELILILAIMGIIIVIAVPKFDFSDSEMKRYGRELTMDLNYIKTKSKTSNNNSENRIRLESKHYELYIDNKVNKTKKLKENFQITTNLKPNIIPETIQFTRMGAPSRACSIFIINNDNNKYIKISITPATGRIHMYENIEEGYNNKIRDEVGTY